MNNVALSAFVLFLGVKEQHEENHLGDVHSDENKHSVVSPMTYRSWNI